MRCGICLMARDEKAVWAELIRSLHRPETRWQADWLITDGPLDDGLYMSETLTAAFAESTYLQEARVLLLPAGKTQPNELPDWEAFLNSPAITAIYFYDWREFEIYTKDDAALSALAHLETSDQAASFEWIDDADVGRTQF